jgi:Ca2+-binding EF-hand superfamily protein
MVFKQYDVNGNGSLDYKEFSAVFFGNANPSEKAS